MPILSNFPGGAGSGSGGVTLGAVSNINVLVASGKVYVKWTDPSDIVVSGSTLAAWGGTLLVRKAGSAPKSRRDGTVVLDSKTRDAYKCIYSNAYRSGHWHFKLECDRYDCFRRSWKRQNDR